jgi:hypothetical protein
VLLTTRAGQVREKLLGAKSQFDKAMDDLKLVGAYEPLMEAAHLQALTCNRLGMTAERDRAAEHFLQAQRLLETSKWVPVSPMSNLATCPAAELNALACEV